MKIDLDGNKEALDVISVTAAQTATNIIVRIHIRPGFIGFMSSQEPWPMHYIKRTEDGRSILVFHYIDKITRVIFIPETSHEAYILRDGTSFTRPGITSMEVLLTPPIPNDFQLLWNPDKEAVRERR